MTAETRIYLTLLILCAPVIMALIATVLRQADMIRATRRRMRAANERARTWKRYARALHRRTVELLVTPCCEECAAEPAEDLRVTPEEAAELAAMFGGDVATEAETWLHNRPSTEEGP